MHTQSLRTLLYHTITGSIAPYVAHIFIPLDKKAGGKDDLDCQQKQKIMQVMSNVILILSFSFCRAQWLHLHSQHMYVSQGHVLCKPS